MKAKCPNPICLYEWDTNSQMILVSCPSCGTKVKIRDKVQGDSAPVKNHGNISRGKKK